MLGLCAIFCQVAADTAATVAGLEQAVNAIVVGTGTAAALGPLLAAVGTAAGQLANGGADGSDQTT